MKLTFDTRPRYGHNHASGLREHAWTKITYMAHGEGYVMARRPGYSPFILTEKQWIEFAYYDGQDAPAGRLALANGGRERQSLSADRQGGTE